MNGIENWVFLSYFYDSSTPGYGGKTDFIIENTKCISHGDSCNQFKFSMSNHVGTHIDLPFHFCKNGKKLQDYSASEWMYKKIEVVDIELDPNQLITSKILPLLNNETEALILKTQFGCFRKSEKYWKENPGLTSELGNFLKSKYKNLKLIGFDFISATSFANKQEGRLAHYSFLGSDNGCPILILEDMNLESLNQKKILKMNISPLLIRDADGVPVTISALVG